MELLEAVTSEVSKPKAEVKPFPPLECIYMKAKPGAPFALLAWHRKGDVAATQLSKMVADDMKRLLGVKEFKTAEFPNLAKVPDYLPGSDDVNENTEGGN